MHHVDPVIQRILYAWSAAWIVFLGIVGMYLHDSGAPIASLVASGHNHGLSFAFAAIFTGLLLWKLHGMKKGAQWLACLLTIVSFVLPLGLLIAGWTGTTGFLSTTSAIGGGAFVLNWLLLGVFALFRGTDKSGCGPNCKHEHGKM